MEKSKQDNNQVTSRQRVKDHGEVFTQEREVNAMLDLVGNETERIESRFLEPACTGNFWCRCWKGGLPLSEKVTGLTQKDFELLISLGVFNKALMNDAVYKFKRYEDASLAYAGANKHEGEDIGLFDTVINAKEYGQPFENHQVE